MKQIKYAVKDELGIHARPAGMLVKVAMGFKSAVKMNAKGKEADAKRIMAVMGLGVKKGDEITINIDGEDEDAAKTAMEDFLKANL